MNDHYFTCPQCGGHYFGRDTAKADNRSGVKILDTVLCHDEHKIGCKWRGVWPVKGEASEVVKAIVGRQ